MTAGGPEEAAVVFLTGLELAGLLPLELEESSDKEEEADDDEDDEDDDRFLLPVRGFLPAGGFLSSFRKFLAERT